MIGAQQSFGIFPYGNGLRSYPYRIQPEVRALLFKWWFYIPILTITLYRYSGFNKKNSVDLALTSQKLESKVLSYIYLLG